MGRRLLLLGALGGCALLVAGCGGKKREAGYLYKRDPVVPCLRSHNYTVSTQEKDVNFIAYTATGGGLRAWENGTGHKVDLILAFGRSATDAKQTMKAVKRFALRPPIFRWRIRRANVVILYAYKPSQENRSLLVDCLNRSIGG